MIPREILKKNPADQDSHEPHRDRNRLDAAGGNEHIDTMKLKDESVRYLTKAELEAAREEEHRERVELSQRVARGEITAAEANREASIFHPDVFDPATMKTANMDEVVENLLKLRPRRRHERRKQKTIRY